jgi:hypothetical protein
MSLSQRLGWIGMLRRGWGEFLFLFLAIIP